ncbi:hypothetical protein [Mycobacterium sp.]|uniref:hypothetical protein n=1 Tax=Mycobacterium sp. TaxID=1785 RepID=UPI0031D9AB5D
MSQGVFGGIQGEHLGVVKILRCIGGSTEILYRDLVGARGGTLRLEPAPKIFIARQTKRCRDSVDAGYRRVRQSSDEHIRHANP